MQNDDETAEHQSGWSWSVSENAHNSWATWYILIKLCLLIHFKVDSVYQIKLNNNRQQEKCRS